MFKTKIKFIPERPGERFNSLKIKNSTYRELNFKPTKSIKEYIENYISKKKLKKFFKFHYLFAKKKKIYIYVQYLNICRKKF